MCVCVCVWQKMLANLEVNETWNWVNFFGVLCEQRSIYNKPKWRKNWVITTAQMERKISCYGSLNRNKNVLLW